jgi:excisionase family DNA binding protein
MTTILQMNQDDLRIEIRNCIRESIEEMRNIPQPAPPPDRISFDEACEIAGLSRSLMYKKSMDGSIPKLKYGNRLVFSRKEIESWMELRTIRTQSLEETATKQLQKVARKLLK